jgi:hypothetical protein
MRQTTECLLNELMVRYDRARAQRTRGAPREDGAEEAFDRLCDGVIRPAMAQFAQVLETHGHRCRIYKKPMSVTTPGNLTQGAQIMMQILPKSLSEPPGTGPGAGGGCQISFVLAPEPAKVRAQLSHGASAELCSMCPHDLHPVAGVTQELIEAELLEMVQHVFATAWRTGDPR